MLRRRETSCSGSGRASVALALLVGSWTSSAAAGNLGRTAAGAGSMDDPGAFALDTAVEYEDDGDEQITVFEVGLQVQMSDRIQLLVEASLYERLDPGAGDAIDGVGDVDVNGYWLVTGQEGWRPALVVGARVKLPTASDELGTGEPDLAALVNLSAERGKLELALEVELVAVGEPSGVALDDQVVYALAVEYSPLEPLTVYGEVFGESAPSPAEDRTDAALLGAEVDLSRVEWFGPYVSLELDTDQTVTARAGVEWAW